MKQKLLIIHSLYYPVVVGGAEISTKILAEAMSEDYEVHVICVGDHSWKEGVKVDIQSGVHVYRLPVNNSIWIGSFNNEKWYKKVLFRFQDIYNWRQYRLIKQIMKQIQPAIVHTQNLWGISLAAWHAAHMSGLPVVHTLRDYALLTPIKSNLYSMFYRWLARHFSRKVSAVIGISNHILNKHEDYRLFDRSEKFVVSNAVEGKTVRKMNNRDPSSPLVIGYFGRLESIKGVHHLIRAVKRLEDTIVSEVILCGDGQEKESLVQLADGDERIRFTGKVESQQVRSYMQEVDLIVVPSIWEEPFGRVIIEAYQVGTPVLATNIGGIPELVIKPDMFLIPPDDEESIVEGIKRYHALSKYERDKISYACNNRSELFSVESLKKQHQRIYEGVLSRTEQPQLQSVAGTN